MEESVLRVIHRETVEIEEAFNALPKETQSHSECVAAVSGMLLDWAEEAFPGEYSDGFSREELVRGARYHDVGISLVPARVLEKAEGLTGPEYRVVQKHVLYGAALLEDYRSAQSCPPGETRFWTFAAEIALGHHERWDGKGYPFGQLASATPEAARIVCVADAFDGIVRGGPHRMALPMEYAVLEIMQNAGKQFDPRLAELLRLHCTDVFWFYGREEI